MSKYTTMVRWLVETKYDLGLKDYPIFDESYRATLNAKIIQHYYFHEIGFEVPGLFVNRLNERMNMIMPYYNQLYESTKLQFEPLITTDITESTDNLTTADTNTKASTDTTASRTQDNNETLTISGTRDTTETGKHTEDSTDTKARKDIGSDTPQGLLSLPNIDSNLYASTAAIGSEDDTHTETVDDNVNRIENRSDNHRRTGDITAKENAQGESSTTGKTTSTGQTTRHLTGIQNVHQAKLLEEYRRTFLNIDQQVINELQDLFMLIY